MKRNPIVLGIAVIIGMFAVLGVLLALQTVEGGNWQTIAQACAPLIVMIGILALVLVGLVTR